MLFSATHRSGGSLSWRIYASCTCSREQTTLIYLPVVATVANSNTATVEHYNARNFQKYNSTKWCRCDAQGLHSVEGSAALNTLVQACNTSYTSIAVSYVLLQQLMAGVGGQHQPQQCMQLYASLQSSITAFSSVPCLSTAILLHVKKPSAHPMSHAYSESLNH